MQGYAGHGGTTGSSMSWHNSPRSISKMACLDLLRGYPVLKQ